MRLTSKKNLYSYKQEKVVCTKPNCYWKSLTDSERELSKTLLECLAIVWLGLLLCPYRKGIRFIVTTIFNSPKWNFNQTSSTLWLARWRSQVFTFEVEVFYRSCNKQQAADVLSRKLTNEEDNTPLDNDISIPPMETIKALPDRHIYVANLQGYHRVISRRSN